MAKAKICKLEYVHDDDHVEYFLFPDLPNNLTSDCAEQDMRKYLENVLGEIVIIVSEMVKEREYLWHKDAFQLQIHTGLKQDRNLKKDTENIKEQMMKKMHCQGSLPPHLHGVTHFGDNITDEWFVVYLITEITRKIPNCIGRVVDSDGEFLMIEAADVLPKWANAETCDQRVFIANGQLQLVQNSPSNTASVLPIASSLAKIRCNPTLYVVSNEIELCIQKRFKDFIDALTYNKSSIHNQIVCVPLKIALLLKKQPSLIAAAVRAFCDRDAIDKKLMPAARFFPPDKLVRINVRFTRCLYAMAMHTNYKQCQKDWKIERGDDNEKNKEEILGMKIMCGFDMLVAQAKDSFDEGNEPIWHDYLEKLIAKGYFCDNLIGSKAYIDLWKKARDYYGKNSMLFQSKSLVGQQILDTLSVMDDTKEEKDALNLDKENVKASDSDDWLNVTPEQLDTMLFEYFNMKLHKCNDKKAAKELTVQIANFLEKRSEFDGIENNNDGDGSDGHKEYAATTSDENSVTSASASASTSADANVKSDYNFMNMNEEKFSSENVKNCLDMVIPDDDWESTSEMSDYDNENDLKRHIKAMENADVNFDRDIKAYMEQMDKELSKTTIGKSFELIPNTEQTDGKNASGSASKDNDEEPKGAQATAAGGDDFDDIESFKPVDINVNTLKNIVNSFKSQVGGPGPASNLLSAMGIGMSDVCDADDKNKENLSESTV